MNTIFQCVNVVTGEILKPFTELRHARCALTQVWKRKQRWHMKSIDQAEALRDWQIEELKVVEQVTARHPAIAGGALPITTALANYLTANV